jgi:hypothetical protein
MKDGTHNNVSHNSSNSVMPIAIAISLTGFTTSLATIATLHWV